MGVSLGPNLVEPAHNTRPSPALIRRTHVGAGLAPPGRCVLTPNPSGAPRSIWSAALQASPLQSQPITNASAQHRLSLCVRPTSARCISMRFNPSTSSPTPPPAAASLPSTPNNQFYTSPISISLPPPSAPNPRLRLLLRHPARNQPFHLLLRPAPDHDQPIEILHKAASINSAASTNATERPSRSNSSNCFRISASTRG